MQTFLGIIVAVIFILAYFPQLKSLKNSSDISGVSTFFWMLIALGTAITASTLWEAHAVRICYRTINHGYKYHNYRSACFSSNNRSY